jgi:hypothetical protein
LKAEILEKDTNNLLGYKQTTSGLSELNNIGSKLDKMETSTIENSTQNVGVGTMNKGSDVEILVLEEESGSTMPDSVEATNVGDRSFEMLNEGGNTLNTSTPLAIRMQKRMKAKEFRSARRSMTPIPVII